ncbi:MAG TPA: RidA family protein, partial [Gemmatimonadales bacterium]|nr:RidA family protein [Gemmatimonadales bacterium]
MMDILQPAGWHRPRGYSHGMSARGRIVAVSGQVGWNPASGEFERDDFIGQADQALRNIVAVLKSGGAEPKDLVRLTWYIINRSDYLAAQKPLGQAYREIIG